MIETYQARCTKVVEACELSQHAAFVSLARGELAWHGEE